MSPSGLVIILCVKLAPGPDVSVCTILAPTSKSVALVVVTAPLLLVALLPVPALTTSTGEIGSIPLYSKILMSANWAACEKLTVTLFPLGAAVIFLA